MKILQVLEPIEVVLGLGAPINTHGGDLGRVELLGSLPGDKREVGGNSRRVEVIGASGPGAALRPARVDGVVGGVGRGCIGASGVDLQVGVEVAREVVHVAVAHV